MADRSNIEWCDSTWNATVGCTIVSPGCTNCYAMKTAHGLEHRFGSKKYGGLTKVVNGNPVWTGEVRLDEDALLQPLKWKKPRRIFVNSMSDLFHESLPDEAIDRVFTVMALCPQHTFQVLTKRAERMRDYCAKLWSQGIESGMCARYMAQHRIWMHLPKIDQRHLGCRVPRWPLPNVWLGVSCERQQEADERIPLLLQAPAAIRFVSLEPLLAPIDLTRLAPLSHDDGSTTFDNALTGAMECTLAEHRQDNWIHPLDWVIVGGESSKNARPMHPQWVLDIRDQCVADGVPFFFKQRGEYTWIDGGDYDADRIPDLPDNWRERKDDKYICMRADGSRASGYGGDSAEFLYRVGKKAAGRLLDGKEHNEFPQVSA